MRTTYIKEKNFVYDNGAKTTRRGLVTAENQNSLRGFDISRLNKGQASYIRNSWEKIQNQNWSLATKERKVMEMVGTPAKRNFRTFRIHNIKSYL